MGMMDDYTVTSMYTTISATVYIEETTECLANFLALYLLQANQMQY